MSRPSPSLTPNEQVAFDALLNVPAWAAQRDVGIGARMLCAVADERHMSIEAMQRAANALVRKDRAVKVAPGIYALPYWKAAKP